MRTTGIVRRMDDLGRIVIPKEIRRNMGIKEGQALEIFLDGDYVCFRKYSPLDEDFRARIPQIIEAMFDNVALLGYDEECIMCCGSIPNANLNTQTNKHKNCVTNICLDGECVGYIVTKEEDLAQAKIAVDVIKTILAD